MPDDNRERWRWLPKSNLSRRSIEKRMHKVETATVRHAHKFIIKRWSNVRDVQRHVITWIVIVGVLIAATGLQLMRYQQSYKDTAFTKDGTYAEAVLGPVNTLNPLFASTSAEKSISYLMFSSLLRYDTTGHLNNDLATSIKINDANNVYTISIRSDAKWQDGVSLTANDIAFTVKLMQNPNTHSTISGWQGVTVKVINDTTIEFSLPAVYSAFEHALTFSVLPEHILGNVSPSNIRENSFSQNPIGSGPFKLNFIQNVDTNSTKKIIYMDRNDQYYGGTANLSNFLLYVYDTKDEIVQALATNAVNAAADLSLGDTKKVDSKKYVIQSESIQSGVYAIINTKSAILGDVNLRSALRLATDTVALRKKLSNANLSLDLPFTNGQLTGDVPKAPSYDKVAAEKLLDENGWKLNAQNIREKDGKVLKISVVAMKDSEQEIAL